MMKCHFFILRFSKCIHISVTDEIKNHLIKTFKFKPSRSIVIQNGYLKTQPVPNEINHELVNKIKKIDKTQYKIGVFIGTNQKWHGTDTIVKLFSTLPNTIIMFIGPIPTHSCSNNMLFVNKQNTSTINQILDNIDFAIGSFNIQINHMKEACPLKVREYLFHGLPVLINYNDMCEKISDIKPYIYNMQQNPNAHIEIISHKSNKNDLIKAAEKHLSWPTLLKNI